MPNIKLKGQNGENLTFNDVERVYFDSADQEGEVVCYTHGKVMEGVTIEPDFANGDQVFSVPDGSLVKEATIVKPATLVPENIRAGTNVAGVVGEFIGDTEERTVDLNFSSGAAETDIMPLTTITGFAANPDYYDLIMANADPVYELIVGETYMVNWDGEMWECVAQDVSSLLGDGGVGIGNGGDFGFSGNGEPFIILADGFLRPAYVALTDTEDGGSHTVRIYQVTEGAGASDMVVTPSEDGKVMSKVTIKKPKTLIPENIAKDVDIGGVVGTFEGGVGATKEIEPDFSAGDQTVAAGENELWSEVIVKKPESLLAGNIVSGVNIAGIIGTFEAPKIVVKEISGSTATSGLLTLFSADELASIGFANASYRFALIIQAENGAPTAASWNKLAMNYIRYPYNVQTGSSAYNYGYYSYHNKNGSYSNIATPKNISSNPWDGTTQSNTMFYADGEIKFNMESTYGRLSKSSLAASPYYVIAGCY